jgi:hypothetical protein
MATSSVKPTTRETSAYVRDKGMRAVIVTVHHGLLELRAKGLRSAYTLDIGSLYYQAVRQEVAKQRAEKKAAKKARRK